MHVDIVCRAHLVCNDDAGDDDDDGDGNEWKFWECWNMARWVRVSSNFLCEKAFAILSVERCRWQRQQRYNVCAQIMNAFCFGGAPYT